MMHTFFKLLMSVLLLCVSAPIAAGQTASVTAGDGVVYEFAPRVVKSVLVAPGQTVRVGEDCSLRERQGLWEVKTICTWSETIQGTDEGIVVLAGGSEPTSASRPEVLFAMLGITCMAVAMLLFLLFDAASAAIVAAALALALALAAVALAAAFIFAASAAAFIFAAAFTFTFAAAEDKSKQWTVFFGTIYIILMLAVVFV